ncbi:MAG: hypothetical protein C4345_13115, partial [Chloroflexota bacterium]
MEFSVSDARSGPRPGSGSQPAATDTVLMEMDHVGHQFDRDGSEVVTVVNPLRAGLQLDRVPAPCVTVIFGVSGDLATRKLMPALYDLAVGLPLPEGFSIVGVSRREWSDDEFRAEMRKAVTTHARTPVTEESWDSFARGLFYVRGDFDDPETYSRLKERLETVDRERRAQGNRLFYLATPPSFYIPIIENLGRCGIAHRQDIYSDTQQGWNRIV